MCCVYIFPVYYIDPKRTKRKIFVGKIAIFLCKITIKREIEKTGSVQEDLKEEGKIAEDF